MPAKYQAKPPPNQFDIDRVIETAHFDEIIAAILDAKYSWACVLILRFAGQCPCDYIPSRTYRRIAGEHLQAPQNNTANNAANLANKP